MQNHIVALVDCDSFFVSCEQVLNPKLCGQPVCVVTGDNGCIVSRSKEAKKIGVKMGIPLFMARKDFPEVTYVNAKHDYYYRFSQQVMECLRHVVAEVEVTSIDEAYIDLTSLDKVYHCDYVTLAKKIRAYIKQKTRIPVSIGVSSSKLLAKLASDKAKSRGGVFAINPQNQQKVLQHTDINEVCGIGQSHSKLMDYNGIFTAWDFVKQSDIWLRKQMGIVGLELKYELQGYYLNKISTIAVAPKSVQDTSVLPSFTADIEVIKSEIMQHLHQACHRMRKSNCYCTTAGIMLRTKNFSVVSDKIKLPMASNVEFDIAKSIFPLLKNIYHPNVVYRSSGVFLIDLIDKNFYQPELFEQVHFKSSPLSKVWDDLEEKYGKGIIKTGYL